MASEREILRKLKTPMINFDVSGLKNLNETLLRVQSFDIEVGVVDRRKKFLQDLAKWQSFGTRPYKGREPRYRKRWTTRGGKRTKAWVRKRWHIPPRKFLQKTYQEFGRSGLKGFQDDIYKAAKEEWSGEPYKLSDYKIKKIMKKHGSYLKDYMLFIIYRGLSPRLESATVAQKKRRGYPYPRTPIVGRGTLVNAIGVAVRSKRRR